VALTFDYKGWGASEGARTRLAPYSRVADAQAGITFLTMRAEVDPDRIGLFGTSYGGSTVTWVGAVDRRASCIVSVVGVGNGKRWMSRVRRPDEWHDLMALSKKDREQRVTTGESEFVERGSVLLPDRQSAELAAAQRRGNPSAINEVPLEYVDDTLGFNAEWVVDKVAPTPIMFITTDNDRLVLPEESEEMYAKAGEPKKLVMLKGYSHYEVYEGPAFEEVMTHSLDWYRTHIPPK
jgi:dipeptidyl aminopeptidase/acylaminoacyl peptidase